MIVDHVSSFRAGNQNIPFRAKFWLSIAATLTLNLGSLLADDGSANFQRLSAQYQAQLQKVDAPLKELFQGYRSRLAALEQAAKAQGKLEQVQEVRTALSEVTENGYYGSYQLPEGLRDRFPDLAKAKLLLMEERHKRLFRTAPTAKRLKEAYLERLRLLEIELTRKRNLEEALKVRSERTQVANELQLLATVISSTRAPFRINTSSTTHSGRLVGTGVWWNDPFEIPSKYRNQKFTKVIASNLHWIALREDGSVVVDLPSFTINSDSEALRRIPGGLSKSVVDIEATNSLNLALKKDGTLVGWGPPKAPSVASFPKRGMKEVINFGVGWAWGAALDKSGNVTYWGNIFQDGDPPSHLTTNVRRILLTYGPMVVITNPGEVYLVRGTSIEKLPIDGNRIVELSDGHNFVLALLDTGEVIQLCTGRTDPLLGPGEAATRMNATRFNRDYVLTRSGQWKTWDNTPIDPFFDSLDPAKLIDLDGFVSDNAINGIHYQTRYYIGIEQGS